MLLPDLDRRVVAVEMRRVRVDPSLTQGVELLQPVLPLPRDEPVALVLALLLRSRPPS